MSGRSASNDPASPPSGPAIMNKRYRFAIAIYALLVVIAIVALAVTLLLDQYLKGAFRAHSAVFATLAYIALPILFIRMLLRSRRTGKLRLSRFSNLAGAQIAFALLLSGWEAALLCFLPAALVVYGSRKASDR
jgi:hypothetical protein